MRLLIILVALIAGFYSGWREHRKDGAPPPAAVDCASKIEGDAVATWAADATPRAFNFKVGVDAAATSDTSLFSDFGWNGMLSAGRKASMLSKQGLNADYGVSHVNLQVTGAVDAQQISAGSNGLANKWWVTVPITVGPPEARLAGPMKLELSVTCGSAKQGAPLVIDQWVMSPAN